MRERSSGLSQKLRQAARNMLYNRSNTKETNIDICIAAPYRGMQKLTGFTVSVSFLEVPKLELKIK